MLTPSEARQLEGVSRRHKVPVPEFICAAMRQHDGLSTESDHQPGPHDVKRGTRSS